MKNAGSCRILTCQPWISLITVETSIKAIGRLSNTSGVTGTLIGQSFKVFMIFWKKDQNSITPNPILRCFALIWPSVRLSLIKRVHVGKVGGWKVHFPPSVGHFITLENWKHEVKVCRPPQVLRCLTCFLNVLKSFWSPKVQKQQFYTRLKRWNVNYLAWLRESWTVAKSEVLAVLHQGYTSSWTVLADQTVWEPLTLSTNVCFELSSVLGSLLCSEWAETQKFSGEIADYF